MQTVLNPMVEPDPTPATFVPGPAGTHITIRNLTKYFAGWPLYENFNLDIPKNQIVSVFGPNGCGKSTLINMIAGLIQSSNFQCSTTSLSSKWCSVCSELAFDLHLIILIRNPARA